MLGRAPAAARARWLDLAVLLALGGLWIGALLRSGALGGDYQLADDHEILRLSAALEGGGLGAVAPGLRFDVLYRFRPLYGLHRILEAAVFGDRLLAWSVYTACLGLASCWALYAAARLLRCSPLEAAIFAFFGLAGEQSAVFWRRGPAEAEGVALLSCAVLALACSARGRSLAARVAFVGSAALMSLCKETFVLAIPALLFGLLWAVRAGAGSWRGVARACAAELGCLGALVAAELLLIALVVGTDNMGYAGVSGLGWAAVWRTGQRFLAHGGVWRVVLALGAVGAASAGWASLRRLLPAIALTALLVVPQAVAYAKSGVFERYYLPGALGMAFLAAWGVRALRQPPDGARPIWPLPVAVPTFSRALAWLLGRPTLVGLLAALAFLPGAVAQAQTLYERAVDFARDGRAQQRFLDKLTTPRCAGPVLVAGGLPGVEEHFLSIQRYLGLRQGRDDLYFQYLAPRGPLSDFERAMVRGFLSGTRLPRFGQVADPRRFDCIGILEGDELAFVDENRGWFDREAYARQAARGFAVYRRLAPGPGGAPP